MRINKTAVPISEISARESLLCKIFDKKEDPFVLTYLNLKDWSEKERSLSFFLMTEKTYTFENLFKQTRDQELIRWFIGLWESYEITKFIQEFAAK